MSNSYAIMFLCFFGGLAVAGMTAALLGRRAARRAKFRERIIEAGFRDLMNRYGDELFERLKKRDEGRPKKDGNASEFKPGDLVALAMRQAEESKAFAERTLKLLEEENRRLLEAIEKAKKKRGGEDA